MPVVNTSFAELKEMIGKDISQEELGSMLFDFGMELDEVEEDEAKIEITAERHDLLSAQGVARALKAYDGIAPLRLLRRYVAPNFSCISIISLSFFSSSFNPFTTAHTT